MTRTVLDNHGVAHVWAQGEQSAARSNNGNFYFEGPALYSYGTHYPVGILVEGVALLNGDKSTPTTEGKHKNPARSAVSHRTAYTLPALSDAARALVALAGRSDARVTPARWYDTQDATRDLLAYCERHALALAGRYPSATRAQDQEAERRAREEADREGRNAEPWGDFYRRQVRHLAEVQAEAEAPDALGFLLDLVGRGRSRARIIRDAEAAKRKAQAAQEARQEAERQAHAFRLAEVTPAQWRGRIREAMGNYNAADLLGQMSRGLLAAQKWSKGRKGWNARHESLRAARAQVREALADVDRRQARVVAWNQARAAIGCLRGLAEAEAHGLVALSHLAGDGQAPDHAAPDATQDARERAALAARFNLARLLDAPTLAPAIRRKAQAALERVAPVAEEVEATRLARAQAAQEERRRLAALAEEERRQEWLAGNPGVHWHGRTPTGGAILRAVGVTRDESGAITGGELQTSQGARVPLAHALRVFRFLKHCRATGTTWHRNGRKIRVGHYQVDSVQEDGTFRAGCHLIEWPQVEALAERLGVLDLAPDSSVGAAHEVTA